MILNLVIFVLIEKERGNIEEHAFITDFYKR
jgi:hypothetical protein